MNKWISLSILYIFSKFKINDSKFLTKSDEMKRTNEQKVGENAEEIFVSSQIFFEMKIFQN